MFVYLFFLLPAGLITLVMRDLAFFWMLWRSSWTKNSELTLSSSLLSFFVFFCTTHSQHFQLCLFFFVFRQENIDKRNQHKLIQCLKAFMNNKVCVNQHWKENPLNWFSGSWFLKIYHPCLISCFHFLTVLMIIWIRCVHRVRIWDHGL